MVLGMLAIHVALIPLLFGGVLFIVKQGYQDQFVNHVRTDAGLFADLAGKSVANGRLQMVLDESMITGRIVYAQVIDNAGRGFASTSIVSSYTTFKEDFFFGQHEDQVYFISLPIYNQQEEGIGTIQLGYDETVTQEQIELAYQRGIYLALAYFFLTTALVGFVGPALTKPLKRLQEASRKIAYGHFEEQLQIDTHITELHNLAEDLNLMRGELVKQADTLQHQALHDGLTGLPNRSLLQDRLQQAMHVAERTRQSLALVLMDLDHFKEINDALGHAIGDILLQQVGARLQKTARGSDTVARLGGDEFALVLLASTEEDIKNVTALIVNAMQEPFMIEGQSFRVGASIGISLFPEHASDFDTLLRKADVAMYESKRSHSAYTVYETSLDRDSLSQLVLGGELSKALERREFILVYQPKINAKTGLANGVEALVRWQHPRRGLIYPEEFIHLAEKTGLIEPLTLWIMEEGLRQWAVWQTLGIDVNIAINLSAHCLQDEALAMRIEEVLRAQRAPSSTLTLELTESAIMSNPAQAMSTFSHLHAMGVRLSIDDFGTGYSSLTHLKKLPLHEIKIDKSFVIDMLTDNSNAAIVQTMISLAHNLGIVVVAEGVEQELAFHLLKRMGCDSLQGFYISEPLKAMEFENWYYQAALAANKLARNKDKT